MILAMQMNRSSSWCAEGDKRRFGVCGSNHALDSKSPVRASKAPMQLKASPDSAPPDPRSKSPDQILIKSEIARASGITIRPSDTPLLRADSLVSLNRRRQASCLQLNENGAEPYPAVLDVLAPQMRKPKGAAVSEVIVTRLRSLLRSTRSSFLEGASGREIWHWQLPAPRSPWESFVDLRLRSASPSSSHFKRFRPVDFQPRVRLNSKDLTMQPRSLSYKGASIHARRALLAAYYGGYPSIKSLFQKLHIESVMYQLFFTQEPMSIWRKFVYYYCIEFEKCVVTFNGDIDAGIDQLFEIFALVESEKLAPVVVPETLRRRSSPNQCNESYQYKESLNQDVPSIEFQIAYFLMSSPGIYRDTVARFLTKHNLKRFHHDKNFSSRVLNHFVDLLDYSNLDIGQALRFFTNHYPLIGESQDIYKAMEAFGAAFCLCRLCEAQQAMVERVKTSTNGGEILKLETASLFAKSLVIVNHAELAATLRTSHKFRRLLGKGELGSRWSRSCDHKRTQSGPASRESEMQASLLATPSTGVPSAGGDLSPTGKVFEDDHLANPLALLKSTHAEAASEIWARTDTMSHQKAGSETTGDSLTILTEEEASGESERNCESDGEIFQTVENEIDTLLDKVEDRRYLTFQKNHVLLNQDRLQAIEDSMLTVAYALIILHTSKHNPNVQNHKTAQLTKQHFRQMISKASKVQIPPHMIDALYGSFATKPLKTPESSISMFAQEKKNHQSLLRLCVGCGSQENLIPLTNVSSVPVIEETAPESASFLKLSERANVSKWRTVWIDAETQTLAWSVNPSATTGGEGQTFLRRHSAVPASLDFAPSSGGWGEGLRRKLTKFKVASRSEAVCRSEALPRTCPSNASSDSGTQPQTSVVSKDCSDTSAVSRSLLHTAATSGNAHIVSGPVRCPTNVSSKQTSSKTSVKIPASALDEHKLTSLNFCPRQLKATAFAPKHEPISSIIACALLSPNYLSRLLVRWSDRAVITEGETYAASHSAFIDELRRSTQLQNHIIHVVFDSRSPLQLLQPSEMPDNAVTTWFHYLTGRVHVNYSVRSLNAPKAVRARVSLHRQLLNRKALFRLAHVSASNDPANKGDTEWKISAARTLSRQAALRLKARETTAAALARNTNQKHPDGWQLLQWIQNLLSSDKVEIPRCLYSSKIEPILAKELSKEDPRTTAHHLPELVMRMAAEMLKKYPFLLLPNFALQSSLELADLILPLLSMERIDLTDCPLPDLRSCYKVISRRYHTKIFLKHNALGFCFEDIRFQSGEETSNANHVEGANGPIKGEVCVIAAVKMLVALCSLNLLSEPRPAHLLILSYVTQLVNFDDPLCLRIAAAFITALESKFLLDAAEGVFSYEMNLVRNRCPLNSLHWEEMGFDIYNILEGWHASLFLNYVPIVSIASIWNEVFDRLGNRSFLESKVVELFATMTMSDAAIFLDLQELHFLFGDPLSWFSWDNGFLRKWSLT